MNQKTVEINITGIVQGVGFRPFLFNLARDLGLKGYVLNRGNAGVRLVLQGKENAIDTFAERVQQEKPNISYIENLAVETNQPEKQYTQLEIRKSEQGRGISLTLPPDVGICDECLRDMRNKELPKYYQYPFIACAECGPRFTTVEALPYDRERTTMGEFPFCSEGNPESCQEEYSDFNNRRFHAQTFGCSVCGPNYTLYNKSREVIEKQSIKSILKNAAQRINNGEIAAVKGIGGVHLVCLANNDDVILKLRERKGERKYKPFAVMIPEIDIIKPYFQISRKEKEILQSYRRPIVLLEQKENVQPSNISSWVAPGLNNAGFMLPYTGIHYLLFDFIGKKSLIYTSGNKSNIPMGIDNEKIFNQLEELADFFLLHDRPIYQRADDSVLRVHDDKMKIIRRSRGYVPEYLPLPFKVDIPAALATGPELNVTGAVLRRNRIFPTQHIGNVNNLETFEFIKDALFHMKNLLQIKDEEITYIACDSHPAFTTTQLGKELANQYEIPLIDVQHHYAHLLGLMAENKIRPEESIIGITTDGVGYGDDGNIWGGEILLANYETYQRIGHLEYQPMIGGDRATKYPARMLASIILNTVGIEKAKKYFNELEIEKDLEYGKEELTVIIGEFQQANGHYPSKNIPLTSSTGRILDAVSYLLGACNKKTYRGEPAMRLEGLAAHGTAKKISFELQSYMADGTVIINTSQAIMDIWDLLYKQKKSPADIAAKFQKELGRAYARIGIKSAEDHNIKKIGFTGGVAYNYGITKAIKDEVSKANLIFLEHDKIPPGDAGISIGQLIGGLFQFKKRTNA
ncbi:MAG: carbamoyltransferase HypF [Promethearchaeia archaeon]